MTEKVRHSLVVLLNWVVTSQATILSGVLIFILIWICRGDPSHPEFYPVLGFLTFTSIAAGISLAVVYRVERPDRTPEQESHWVLRYPILSLPLALSPIGIALEWSQEQTIRYLAPAFLAFCSLIFLLSAKFLADTKALSEEKNDEPPSRQERQG